MCNVECSAMEVFVCNVECSAMEVFVRNAECSAMMVIARGTTLVFMDEIINHRKADGNDGI